MVAAGFTSTVLAQPGTTWNSWFEDYEEPHISIAGIVQGAKGERLDIWLCPKRLLDIKQQECHIKNLIYA